MSSSADVSIAVAISVFFVIVLGVTNVSATCESPQYAEYGQQGVIKCNFMPGFTGVFWYLSVNSKYQIVIRLEKQQDGTMVRSGDGYSEGKYDIYPDGSLVISNVTEYNNQSFKVVHVDRNLLVEELYVDLLTAIFSGRKFPLINLCNKTNSCLMEKIDSGMLTCSYSRSKPPVELVWYRYSHEGIHRLNGETVVMKDGDWTYSSVLTINISNHVNGPLITFSCHVANPVLNLQVVESSVIVDTTRQAWPLLLENVKQEIYFVIDSTAEVPCNGNKKPVIFIWEQLWRTTSDILMFATRGKQRLFYNVGSKWNISSDGSLVFTNIGFENEGLYTCTFFDGTRYVSNLIQVNVWGKPTPPFIFTNECPQEEGTCEVIVKDKYSPFNISCHLNGVYANVTLAIETDSPLDTQILRRNMYSARRGNVYDITVVAELPPIDCYSVINVTCFLPVPHPLIGEKVISVRSAEDCGATRSSAVVAFIIVIIVIIIIIICAIFLFLKRFFSRTDTEKCENPEEVPFRENDPEENKGRNPEKVPLRETDLEENKEPTKGNSSNIFTLVEDCEEIFDTLLLWPVNGMTEVFDDQAVDVLKGINDKRQASQNKSEVRESVPSFIDILNSYVSWFSSFFSFAQDDQTDEQGRKDQQLITNQLKRTLGTFVQLQKDLLHVITSLALSHDILKSVSRNTNFSDDRYSIKEKQDIQSLLQSLKGEKKDDQDLLNILSGLDKPIGSFLTFLQTLFLDEEDRSVPNKQEYRRRIKARKNISLATLPSAIVTLLKEKNDIVDGINIFNFVTKFYAQSFSQEDVEIATHHENLENIGECEWKIKYNILRIAEGVFAASIDLGSIDERVDIAFLGSFQPSHDIHEEQAFQMNVTMIEIMKKINKIARSMKSLT